jgi:hypothetical protein
MSELTSDQLATRILYIAAKCVQFAATPKDGDISGYIEAGETLNRMLQAWKNLVPASFEPISSDPSHTSLSSISEANHISPMWIHPPAHAAAMQTYHFARIIMILNQPSTGGLNMYQTRFKQLRESTLAICGIAMARQSQNLPSAFVSFQAVYAGQSVCPKADVPSLIHAHAAALCAETEEKQSEILEVLDKILNISKFPSRNLLDDVVRVWRGTQ